MCLRKKARRAVSTFLRKTVVLWQVIPLYLSLFVAVFVYGSAVQGNAADRAYADCVRRVESREDLRGAFLALYSTLEVELHAKPEVVAVLRTALDSTYAPLSLEDC